MRFPPLPALLSAVRSRLRRLLPVAGWMLLALYFVSAAGILALRHGVLPNIDAWRGDIEQALSGALRLPVSIRAIDAHWTGLRPGLAIRGLEIRDAEGRPALAFDRVEADISWTSLWPALHWAPQFSRLEIVAPALDIRRDPAGRVFVAGLPIDTRSQDTAFADWLLAQGRIVVREATVTWHDELRGAPPLALNRLNLDLRNGGGRHRFGLTAEPPRDLAARLDIRGDFRGDVGDGRGELYAELDYADLAGWRAWIDTPAALSRGSGGLRLWLGLADRALKGVTADVRLADVHLRLSPELPPLDLERLEGRLSGRIEGRQWADGFEVRAKGLSLARRDGLRIEPTDFDLRWQPPAAHRAGHLNATASHLDLTALRALAKHFPVEAGLRERLDVLAPQGRLHDLRFAWTDNGDRASGVALHARFEDLGMKAQGSLPGFAGIDGRIDGSETDGVIELASRDAVVEMPTVFAEPRMAFAVLDARASWKSADGMLSANIERAAFRNADAEGSASGRWRGRPGSRGEIYLTAEVRRAAGGAVWRYMPLVVNRDTRDWLRNSIAGGTASATLTLKGDLARFPFRDGSGVFEVRGPFSGATLRYAPAWPPFDDVAGELAFVGERMTIRVDRARLYGVLLSDVKAEIADLELPDEIMTITGAARGPTADFLRFVEASPVGERIDHFTEGMAATGNGELNLNMKMNLRHIADTEVAGRYRFMNDGLAFDADLPPLSGIDGDLRFTADRLEAKGIRASMLGAPMTLDVTTGDAGVAVKAGGTLAVSGLRKQYDHPALDHLSGAAPWNGTIKVRKKTAEVRIESSLQGISSSLPEPFNKNAADSLPLAFERRPVSGQDRISVSLGEAVRAQLVRRQEGGVAVVDRGAVAVGAALPRMPERGVLLLVRGERLDADFWRRLAGGGKGAPLPLTRADVRADALTAFDRTFGDFRLTGALEGGVWKGEVRSRQAAGDFEWSGAGAGRLAARLSKLEIPDGFDGKSGLPKGGGADETLRELPAIHLTAKRFLLKGRDLGELALDAENREDAWHAKFDLRNDDGTLSATAAWRPGPEDAGTALAFKLTAASVEKMLARMGHADAVRRGTATLEGDLAWRGLPSGIDYPTLEGNLKLDAESGQFNKLEPGVGRLLGILSLQSLPRRITLDFRDVFSEGFAFDGIEGRFAVRRGVMETKDLQIRGPSAKVFMTGGVDLGHETQNLRVRVQPAVGETLATGMLLAHPATGAVVWLADKLLKDPLGKAFSFEYAVTGGWADPKVEKIQSAPTKEP